MLAADLDFHEFIPQLFPARAHARDRFAGDLEVRERLARFNGAMQIGYFTLAVRAVGLAAGPMAGFDAPASTPSSSPTRRGGRCW